VESDVEQSFEESSMTEQPPKKARGRPRKSLSATPQPPKPRAKSASIQPPSKPQSAPSTAKTGVRGRKPKMAVVPETQQDISVVEEEDDEVQEVDFAPPPRQSVVPAASRKSSVEGQVRRDRVKDIQTQAEKNFALYKERAEKRFKGT
jgi:hypothetical protein